MFTVEWFLCSINICIYISSLKQDGLFWLLTLKVYIYSVYI